MELVMTTLRIGRIKVFFQDARLFQIVFLMTFLMIGVFIRDFSLQWQQIGLTFLLGLSTQKLWITYFKIPQRGILSAIVTCCGLSLLVRSDSLWVHPFLACVVISSKFLLRIHGKHLYNPANLGAMIALCWLPGSWLSPGQWGQDISLAVWFIVLGTLVTQRSQRLDIGWLFLIFYMGLLALRITWLEQSWDVWFHQLKNGALLLFSFFMISDPMTTPKHPNMRIVFAFLVALFAFTWQFTQFKPNGPIIALFWLTPLVPLLNHWKPAGDFEWRKPVQNESYANLPNVKRS